LNGDYALSTLPGAPRLAAEMGVSYMTARQVVKYLIDGGVLERASTGRLRIADMPHSLQVAMIEPWGYANNMWALCIKKVIAEFKGNLRIICYTHSDDPIIMEALNGDFDLIFMQPPAVDSSPMQIERYQQVKDKLIMACNDLSVHGIRSLLGSPTNSIEMLVRHLTDCGHNSIDCLNTQPCVEEICDRIDIWRQSLKKLGLAGELHNHPVVPFESALKPAYEHSVELIDAGALNANAVFCTTVDAAAGLYRACWERGIKVGEDISICSFGEYERARMMTPALCTIETPDPSDQIRNIIKQFIPGGKKTGQLVYRPNGFKFYEGESVSLAKDSFSLKALNNL
jgi:hypothetical protein